MAARIPRIPRISWIPKALPLGLGMALLLSLGGCTLPLVSGVVLGGPVVGRALAPLLLLVASGLGDIGAPFCLRPEHLSSRLTPIELTRISVTCSRLRHVRAAALSYGVAMTYAGYDDRRRTPGQGPQQVGIGLGQILHQALNEPQRQAFSKELDRVVDQPQGRGELCRLLHRLGPPLYTPDYQVTRRLRVIPSRPSDGGDGVSRPGLLEQAQWQALLQKELPCPAGLAGQDAEGQSKPSRSKISRSLSDSASSGSTFSSMLRARLRYSC